MPNFIYLLNRNILNASIPYVFFSSLFFAVENENQKLYILASEINQHPFYWGRCAFRRKQQLQQRWISENNERMYLKHFRTISTEWPRAF